MERSSRIVGRFRLPLSWAVATERGLRAAGSVFLVLGLLTPLSALAAHDPGRLESLVEEGSYADAYDLASEHVGAHAGDPRFDFYYGIAAVETDRLNEGIFALERVLIAQPGSDRARLELARAYFLQGDDRRARREFLTVQAHEPPADVDAQIERYLLAIQRRADQYETTFSGYVELGGGYDSNVNSATAEESVDTILGPVGLNSASQERSDSFGRLEGRARVSHPVAPDVNLIGELGGRGRFYTDEDQFNTGTLDGRFGALLRRSDWQLQGTVNVGRFYLDGDAYRDQTGVNGSYRLSLSDRSTASLSLDVVDFEYDTREVLDSTLWLIGGGLTHSLQSDLRPTVSARVFFGAEEADDEDSTQAQADAERDIVGVQGGLRMWLNPEWTFRGSAEARLSEYEEPGLFFSEARDEEYYRLDLALDWRPDARWRIGPHLRYSSNQSNNNLYEYDRTEFQIRARYDFY
jgi:hypothetical protein